MPNWCGTTITFTGKYDEIKKIHDFINDKNANDEVGIENGFGSFWLGNYLARAGLDYNKYNCRGEITSIAEIQDNRFSITTDTAWVPMVFMWVKVIEKIAPGVKITYAAEESGCGVYLTNDPTIVGLYYVDICDTDELPEDVYDIFGDEPYDCTEQELRRDLLKVFPDDGNLKTKELIDKFDDEYTGINFYQWEFASIESEI